MDKISVVTGATGGMGFATAKIAGEKTAVLISDVNQQKIDAALAELRGAGVKAEGMVCDVADRESVRGLAQKAKSMGRIVAVYNVAGLSPSNNFPNDIIMKVNAFGALHVNTEFFEIMEGGCLLNVASSGAYWMTEDEIPKELFDLAFTDEEKFKESMLRLAKDAGRDGYAHSKLFVKYFTEKAAFRFGRTKGIRVVSVSPGVIDTPMTQNVSSKGVYAAMPYCAFNRLGTPEELAYSFVALADERNSYVTGVDLLVDGGCGGAGYNARHTKAAPPSIL